MGKHANDLKKKHFRDFFLFEKLSLSTGFAHWPAFSSQFWGVLSRMVLVCVMTSPIPCCGIAPAPLLWNILVRCHVKGMNIHLWLQRDFFFHGSSLADQFFDSACGGFEWFQVLCNYIDACFPICNLIPLHWDLLNGTAQKIAVSLLIPFQWVYFLWQGLSQLLKF